MVKIKKIWQHTYRHTPTHTYRENLKKHMKIHIQNKCLKSTHYRQTLSDGNKHNYKPQGVTENKIIEIVKK